MMNNKGYPPMQQYPRPYAPRGAMPPQGTAGSAPRNPNGPPSMRVQNGPRQVQPQQQQPQTQHQPQQQQQHANNNMLGGGGPSSQQQQQHPQHVQQQHATSAPQGQGQPQQQQGHPQQQQQQMAFAGYPGGSQQFFIPPAGYQYIQSPQGPAYVLNPQGFQQTRYMAPAPGHPPNFQILYTAPPQQHQMYQAAAQQQQNHPTMIQHHQAAAAAQQQAAAHNYYYQQHLAQQNRLPVHTSAVHAPVQVQVSSVHQTPGHVQQQQQQNSQHNPNLPHVPQQQQQQQQQQPSSNSAQMVNRTEVPSGMSERKRERKILKIVDPTTGVCVIGDSSDAKDSSTTATTNSSTEPNQGSGASSVSGTEGNGDVIPPPTTTTTTASANVRDSQTPPEVSAQGPVVIQEEEESVKGPEKVVKPPVAAAAVEEPIAEKSKSKARAEFFQKITQASDDGVSATGRTTSSTPGGVVNPISPTPAAQAPEQPDSPPIDSAKSQQQATVVTPSATAAPSANISSDDSKDTSLVSVSPIPIEAYLTPRKTSPPGGGQVDERSFDEENADSTHEDESLSTTVETKDEDIVSPSQEEEAQLPESETSIIIEVEIDNHQSPDYHHRRSSPSESITKDDDAVSPGVLSSINQDNNNKSESSPPSSHHELSSETEPVSCVAHQNGDMDMELEEGELVCVEDEGIETEGAEETIEGETGETIDKDQPKGKIQYDRDFLMRVGQQIKQTKAPTVPVLSDVAKDANSMRSQNMSKSPGGPNRGGDQFGSMGRRGPGQGPKPGGLGMMGMNYPNRGSGGGGMMGWPPMMVPPRPPPPKVIELTREEVKLHKAENAWKPGSIKHPKKEDRGSEAKDPEEAITDDIVKKTRGILNKLTPENFAKLVQKFMNLPLEDKEERISKVIKVVFEKAVDEPSFSKEYAKMVHTVCGASQETSKKFRKQILDQCQQEFQNNSTDETKIKDAEIQLEQAEEDKKEQLKAELEDLKFQSRRRSLGNIRFIGELFKLQMLTPKIMVECVGMLLSSTDEENLECLCKLLTTVGQKLEEQLDEISARINMVKGLKGKQQDDPSMKMPKFNPGDNWMTKTFNSLRNLSENKNLSSRIRFALLDVVELRDNFWRPRRDANAPKTIDEVRKDAIRQEMEEKRQISNLPPPPMDQRGSSRAGPPQPKKGDWNVQNKSSRFNMVNKSKDSPSTLPLLAPPTWGKSPGGGGGGMPKPPQAIAPRFANRFINLADDNRDRDSRDRLNSNQQQQQQQPSANSRDSMPHSPSPQHQHQHPPPPYNTSSPRRLSPAPSSTSSRESSRPVSPKEIINSGINTTEPTFDVNETVKNIFEEYCTIGNTADSLDWIKQRFPGEKVVDFLDELSRQVGEMSKLTIQQKAGSLVRSLIKSNEISLTKDTVLSTLSRGVIADLPDIMIDVPMVSNYLAQFLVEIFHDDRNLDWLLALDEILRDSEDYASAWNDFCSQSLTVLRSKTNEEVVRSMYTSTKDKSRIPLQNLPWICPDPETIAQEMIPVLKKNMVVNSTTDENEIRQALKENSWDLREDLISHSLIEAICILSWTPELKKWDENALKKLLPVLPENPKLFPSLWKRVMDFIERNDVDKVQQEAIWDILYILSKATATAPPSSE